MNFKKIAALYSLYHGVKYCYKSEVHKGQVLVKVPSLFFYIELENILVPISRIILVYYFLKGKCVLIEIAETKATVATFALSSHLNNFKFSTQNDRSQHTCVIKRLEIHVHCQPSSSIIKSN